MGGKEGRKEEEEGRREARKEGEKKEQLSTYLKDLPARDFVSCY